MIGQFIKGKTAVFIDAANIFYSQHTLGWRIDYEKLSAYLKKETDLDGLYYYTGKVGALEKQMSFIDKLKTCGYHVTAKEVKMIRVSNSQSIPKGSLDVELALDAYRLRKQCVATWRENLSNGPSMCRFRNGARLLRNSKGRTSRPPRSDGCKNI